MKKIIYIFLIMFVVALSACKKSEFLDSRPSNALAVPLTLSDFQKILDNDFRINNTLVPTLAQIGEDTYYVTPKIASSYFNSVQIAMYQWQPNPYSGMDLLDWDNPYQAIYYANSALAALEKYRPNASEISEYDNIKGSGLFLRSYAFFALAQVFSPQYESSLANQSVGIPLKLTPNIDEKVARPTLQAVYDQIIHDVNQSISLLPKLPLYKTRPSKAAAYGLLSRLYLCTQDFNKAKLYADSCLAISHSLVDLNIVDTTSYKPMPLFNDEVVFSCNSSSSSRVENLIFQIVDTTLFASYKKDDLRKTAWFKPSYFGTGAMFVGDYSALTVNNSFSGIAVDEVLLTRAECNARVGKTAEALEDLSTLFKNRFKKGTIISFSFGNTDELLNFIFQERKKELIGRGLRWMDLRRLNLEPKFAVTIKRVFNGTTYTLPPNDKRYTWLIPSNVLSFNPGMQQNPR